MVKFIKRQVVCHGITKILDGHIKFSQFRRFHGTSRLTQYFTHHGCRHSNIIRQGFCAIVPIGNSPGSTIGFLTSHEVSCRSTCWHLVGTKQPFVGRKPQEIDSRAGIKLVQQSRPVGAHGFFVDAKFMGDLLSIHTSAEECKDLSFATGQHWSSRLPLTFLFSAAGRTGQSLPTPTVSAPLTGMRRLLPVTRADRIGLRKRG